MQFINIECPIANVLIQKLQLRHFQRRHKNKLRLITKHEWLLANKCQHKESRIKGEARIEKIYAHSIDTFHAPLKLKSAPSVHIFHTILTPYFNALLVYNSNHLRNGAIFIITWFEPISTLFSNNSFVFVYVDAMAQKYQQNIDTDFVWKRTHFFSFPFKISDPISFCGVFNRLFLRHFFFRFFKRFSEAKKWRKFHALRNVFSFLNSEMPPIIYWRCIFSMKECKVLWIWFRLVTLMKCGMVLENSCRKTIIFNPDFSFKLDKYSNLNNKITNGLC